MSVPRECINLHAFDWIFLIMGQITEEINIMMNREATTFFVS